MSEVMPIKIYKDKVEIASELSVPKGNIANLVSSEGNIANLVSQEGNITNLISQEGNITNLTVGRTANIGNKIILGVAEDGNAALSIAANNITVGDNIIIGSDGNITANSFVGKSISDGNGNNIVETYATKEELSTEISSVNTTLSKYKAEVSNTYALKTEIPSLSGYATETFVNTTLANYVPTSLTINDKALRENITLGAGDVGALSKGNGLIVQMHSLANISVSGGSNVSGGTFSTTTPTGYTPLAVVFVRTGNTGTTSPKNADCVYAYRSDIDSNGIITYSFRNVLSNSAAKFTAFFYVLYIQS